MSDPQLLTTSVEGKVAIVILDRPPVNAVSQSAYEEIRTCFNTVHEWAPDARVVLLAAEGKHFCAGGDLDGFLTLTPENCPDRMTNARTAFWSVRDCPLPVVAAVQGVAVGAGVGLAACSDLVVAADTAKFGLPEISVGIMGGAKFLSRLVPEGMVRRMHYTAELMSVDEIARYGGIAKVVPADQLREEALALARSIAKFAPSAILACKRSLNTIEYLPLKEAYEFEQGLSCELSAYQDSKEAVLAFREKREPHFTDR